jgi:hypothetical protein
MIDYRIFTEEAMFDQAINDSLNYHLYQNPDWLFYVVMANYPEAIRKMGVAYRAHEPVAMSMIWDQNDMPYHERWPGYDLATGCYVADGHRMQRIGATLVEKMEIPEDIFVGRGIAGSSQFWSKQGRPVKN